MFKKPIIHKVSSSCSSMLHAIFGHHDNQYNDIQYNDTYHKDIQHNDTPHNDTQNNNIQQYDSQLIGLLVTLRINGTKHK
jgi:hypothetical protein